MTVLIAVATKHGATREIAEEIGRTLREEGLTVDVVSAEEVTDLARFEAIVIGSAVYIGHWLAPARTLVNENAPTLKARPTWLFSSGPIGDPPRPSAEEAVKVDDLVTAAGAREHRLFAGKVDKHRLGFAERAVLLAVGAKDGDYRDWAAVSAWAREIAVALRT
jgi:menaquinone-dependent protoporphyrinogen oxidase